MNLNDIKNIIAEFSDKTFGADRPYTAPLYKLAEEVQEAIDGGKMEEYADMLLLILDSFRKKYPLTDAQILLDYCEHKVKNILPNRVWGNPDVNGAYHHITEDYDVFPKIATRIKAIVDFDCKKYGYPVIIEQGEIADYSSMFGVFVFELKDHTLRYVSEEDINELLKQDKIILLT
jgi:hypothetical protein